MKIAAFNVENLFNRPKIFDDKNKSESKSVIGASSELSSLFEKGVYSEGDKSRMLELMEILSILRNDEGKFVWLRRIRGGLIKRPKGGKPSIVADGRGDWIGWVEHKTMQVNETAIFNTGRVIRDVGADVLGVVEAENRITLKAFSEAVLAHVNEEVASPTTYDEVMLIDGNDTRGIDVGIMTRNDHRLVSMVSHIEDRSDDGERIFSRDCPEFFIRTAQGNGLVVLPNHLKSKFGGDSPDAKNRRFRQAQRVAAIYQQLRAGGHDNVVVLGDLNDTPDSTALAPLLSGTDLKDISSHPSFDTGEFKGKGTFGLGNDSNKIDYLLLSPALFALVRSSGLFRMGNWPGVKPKPRWKVYPTLTKELHAASDHHVIWADIDI